MAVMVVLEWEGITPLQYDELRSAVGWVDEPPAGGRVHIAAFGNRGVRATDVWDSAEDFQRFVDDRLMPEVQKLGLDGEPEVEVLPLHELFCPNPENIFT